MPEAASPAAPPAAPRAALLAGPVGGVLGRTTGPMLVGMVAMITVNLVDTFWVSRLGTSALAAMTFTFPVEALVVNIAIGLMIGTSVAVARAVGAGRPEEAQRITTDATLLATGVVALVAGAGLLGQRALFRALGADGALLDDVVAYMTPWFVGVGFLVVPMIANGALRALGDPQTPMRVMLVGAVLNAVLDPIFIFGWGPVPAMGLRGASLATVLARFVVMVLVFWVLIRRARLLDLRGVSAAGLRRSWAAVGRVAAPAVVTNAAGPLAVAALTGLLAQHGPAAVAAWGVGARVDGLLLLVPMALSGALGPFIGQNAGAQLRARVADGLRRALWFTVGWGAVTGALALAFAPALAAAFTADPAVQAQITGYLRVMPVGYAFVGGVAVGSAALNAVDRAGRAAALSVLRSLGLALPAAAVGEALAGVHGLLLGLVGASIAAGLLGVRWLTDLLEPFGGAGRRAPPALGAPAVDAWLQARPACAPLAGALGGVLGLDGLVVREVRGGLLGFHIGARELAHLHPHGALDLPLPVEIGDNLVRLGVLAHHPRHEDNGWHRFALRGPGDAPTAAWVLGLAHLLYALSQRGAQDPITEAEMSAFTRTPQCVAALKAAAARWDALPQRAA